MALFIFSKKFRLIVKHSSNISLPKFLANKVLTKKDPKTGIYVDNPDYAKEKKDE